MAVTIESLAAELDQAIALAHKHGQASAICHAVMAKAKLFGLGADRCVVSMNRYAQMSEEELRHELAAIVAEARALKPGVQH